MRRIKRAAALYLIVFASFLGCSPLIAPSPSSSPHHLCFPSAHRGDRLAAFDNSISAIRSAAIHGVPFIETDVRTSPEGDLFLFHDRHLSTANFVGSSTLIGRSADSLSRSDRASLVLPSGDQIATLADALEITNHYAVKLQLDLKPESEQQLNHILEMVSSTGTENNVVIQCQDWQCLFRLRREHPHIKVLARVTRLWELAAVLAMHPFIVQVDQEVLSRPLIDQIHESGSLLLVKTLNPESDLPVVWREICHQGVDIVLTDHPLIFLSEKLTN